MDTSPSVTPTESPRPANQKRVLVFFGVLVGLWVALVITAFVANNKVPAEELADLWGNRTGNFLARLVFALMVPIAATYLSKKRWMWGDVVLWSVIGLVLAYTVL